MKHRYDCIDTLRAAGFSYEDATALRRISMTLHRWHELECGNDNGAIERDEKTGKPYWSSPRSNGKRDRSATPDRERGALKRLAAIMARYPGFESYVQGDPRGAALYILRPGDIPKQDPNCAYSDHDISSYYSRGIVVCQ